MCVRIALMVLDLVVTHETIAGKLGRSQSKSLSRYWHAIHTGIEEIESIVQRVRIIHLRVAAEDDECIANE